MNTYAVPTEISDAMIYEILDAHLDRGYPNLRGDNEDYLRIWYKGDTT
ncbi:MAG: hypothetical protein R3E66_06265 [bacterium]